MGLNDPERDQLLDRKIAAISAWAKASWNPTTPADCVQAMAAKIAALDRELAVIHEREQEDSNAAINYASAGGWRALAGDFDQAIADYEKAIALSVIPKFRTWAMDEIEALKERRQRGAATRVSDTPPAESKEQA